MSTACPIKAIPSLCSGALATSVASGGQWSLSEDVITYASSAAVYGIGKLATQIPSFNPSWEALAAYGFTAATASQTVWTAQQYHISGGQTVGGSSTPVDGVCCAEDSYNTADTQYTLVSWDSLVIGGWTGAGGYCLYSGGEIVSSGYVPPGGGIASPPSIITTLAASISVPSMPAPPSGGGGSGGECNVFIGVVTRSPAGGFGVGAVQSAIFTTDGGYTTSGGDISVVFPYIS